MKFQTTDIAAALSAATFVGVLAISAYWDPSIRVLHAFESLPYLLAAVLCLRRAKLGYALGMVGGTFWLWMASALNTFVRNGFGQLGVLFRTGSVERPDVLIAVPAAAATAGLAVLSLVGYVRLTNKSWRDLAPFAAAVVAVPAFFVAAFALFAPQYLAMFERLFSA
jgi:hypothetical protein